MSFKSVQNVKIDEEWNGLEPLLRIVEAANTKVRRSEYWIAYASNISAGDVYL